jgi:hypothetical protein
MKKTFLLLVNFLICNGLFSQVEFCLNLEPEPQFAGITSPALAKGDFNNDGYIDFCIQAINTNTPPVLTIGILLSNSIGSYTSMLTETVVATNFSPRLLSLAEGDFDGDGNLDLIAVADYDSSFFLMKGDGLGGFTSNTSYATFSVPKTIIAKDLNSDGKSDVIYSSIGSNSVTVLFSNGAGFSGPVNYNLSSSPKQMVYGDFDNNGFGDIYVLTGSGSYFLKGGSSGTFSIISGPNINANDVISVDVSSDSKLDLIYSDIANNKVSIIKGNGNFTFGSALSYSVLGLAGSSQLGIVNYGDFNGDGKIDLLTISSMYHNYITILPGVGNGAFLSPFTYSINTTGRFHLFNFCMADINNDSRPDILALADDGGGTPFCSFKVFLNCNTVGLNENNLTQSMITIFPNPANELLNLQADFLPNDIRCKITLSNHLGQVIREEEITFRNKNAQLNISGLDAGVYSLRLTSKDNVSLFQKFIKE